jgi:hypothetical protein
MDESGAQLHVKAVHERKADGTRVWGTGECEVIPQVDRIGRQHRAGLALLQR